jgi:hypothetical protein
MGAFRVFLRLEEGRGDSIREIVMMESRGEG